MQPFADLMACNVHVKFNPGPLVTFESKPKKGAKTELELECRGGVHFNVLQRETELESQSILKPPAEQTLFFLQDVEDVASSLEFVADSFMVHNVTTPEELPLLNTVLAREEIRFIHEELGHAGRDQVYGTCKRKFRVKGLFELVRNVIKNCDKCQRHKRPIVNRK